MEVDCFNTGVFHLYYLWLSQKKKEKEKRKIFLEVHIKLTPHLPTIQVPHIKLVFKTPKRW